MKIQSTELLIVNRLLFKRPTFAVYGTEVCKVEEERVGRIVVGDPLLRLPGEDIGGVLAVVLPRHAHVTPEVVSPPSLANNLSF